MYDDIILLINLKGKMIINHPQNNNIFALRSNYDSLSFTESFQLCHILLFPIEFQSSKFDNFESDCFNID